MGKITSCPLLPASKIFVFIYTAVAFDFSGNTEGMPASLQMLLLSSLRSLLAAEVIQAALV